MNSVELQGGKQCYLILEELGEVEAAILDNQAKLDACDVLCYAYDSSDADSFAHIVDLPKRHASLQDVPAVYVALKADKDKAVQRTVVQPDEFTRDHDTAAPLHVSVTWSSISELFVHVRTSVSKNNNDGLLIDVVARGDGYDSLTGVLETRSRSPGPYGVLPGRRSCSVCGCRHGGLLEKDTRSLRCG